MGTLASGSIDLKSLKVAGEGASKYITVINNDGIKVHDADDSDNYAKINSNGMEVYQNSISVAQFGATTRIGEENEASITIDSTSIAGDGEGGKKFFNFTNSDVSISSTIIRSTNVAMKDYPTTQSSAITTTIDFDPSSIVVKWHSPDGSYSASLGTFTFGTSATKTKSFTYNSTSYTLNINYDGARTFKSWISKSSTIKAYIRIWYELSKTTLAPSYEIGSGEATGGYALAEGKGTTASGNYSHAEGSDTTASGNYSHAEGSDTTASNIGTHSEGRQTTASGNYSHAEGYGTTAGPGAYSHAEGYATTASGGSSHASGEGTIANRVCQYVIGAYNVEDTQGEYPADKGDYIFIIGNGDDTTPSNALTVDWNGNVDIASGAKYKINGTALAPSDLGEADYVTSTGTSGNWSYRKWNSGKIELWLHEANTTLAITSAVGSMYQSSANVTRTIPSAVTLTSISFSTVNVKQTSYSVWTAEYSCTTTTLTFRAMSALSRSSASGYTIDAYIVGQGS